MYTVAHKDGIISLILTIELNWIELNKGLLEQNTSGSQRLKYACLQT